MSRRTQPYVKVQRVGTELHVTLCASRGGHIKPHPMFVVDGRDPAIAAVAIGQRIDAARDAMKQKEKQVDGGS